MLSCLPFLFSAFKWLSELCSSEWVDLASLEKSLNSFTIHGLVTKLFSWWDCMVEDIILPSRHLEQWTMQQSC